MITEEDVNMKIWTVHTVTLENGTHYAHAWSHTASSALECQMKGGSYHLCASRKEARNLAEYWNNCFRANGTYAFDD